MAPFDRSRTTFYCPTLQLWLYLVLFLSYFTLNNRDLKTGLYVTEDHSNWYQSNAWVLFPFRLP